MIFILKDGKEIGLDELGTTITIVENSMVITSDVAYLTSSYLFPITVPATDHNLRTLEYPNNFLVKATTQTFSAKLRVGSKEYLGRVTTKNANRTGIKLTFTFDVFLNLRKSTLQNLTMPFNLGNNPKLIANLTLNYPLRYPAIFMPILNRHFFGDPPGPLIAPFWN